MTDEQENKEIELLRNATRALRALSELDKNSRARIVRYLLSMLNDVPELSTKDDPPHA